MVPRSSTASVTEPFELLRQLRPAHGLPQEAAGVVGPADRAGRRRPWERLWAVMALHFVAVYEY